MTEGRYGLGDGEYSLGGDAHVESRSLGRIFRWFIGGTIAAELVGIAVVAAFGDLRTALVIAASLPLVLAALVFVRRQRFEMAATFLAVLLIGDITLTSTFGLGIHHLANMGYPVILIVASLVIRRRTMLWLTGLTVACLGWLVFGEISGAFTPGVLVRSVPGDFVIATVIILVTALMVHLVSDAMFKGNRLLFRELRERRRAEALLAKDVGLRLEAERDLLVALDEKSSLLREKELLLKEVHHRVKNNMQVVASLLSLQADSLDDPALVGILRDCQNRIFSLALVHEQLYKSADLARIDFGEYTRQLATSLFSSYDGEVGRVGLKLEVGDFELGIDQAIPCGQILNELASNSLKHAFPGDRRGTLAIGLAETEGGLLELSVEDDGAGMPPDQDWRGAGTLGMQIVNSLVAQLRGSIELERREPGTRFTIRFEKAAPEGLADKERRRP